MHGKSLVFLTHCGCFDVPITRSGNFSVPSKFAHTRTVILSLSEDVLGRIIRHEMQKSCVFPGYHFFWIYTVCLTMNFSVHKTRTFFKPVYPTTGWSEVNIQFRCNFFCLSFKNGSINCSVKCPFLSEPRHKNFFHLFIFCCCYFLSVQLLLVIV
jgi:hypothetical protein